MKRLDFPSRRAALAQFPLFVPDKYPDPKNPLPLPGDPGLAPLTDLYSDTFEPYARECGLLIERGRLLKEAKKRKNPEELARAEAQVRLSEEKLGYAHDLSFFVFKLAAKKQAALPTENTEAALEIFRLGLGCLGVYSSEDYPPHRAFCITYPKP